MGLISERDVVCVYGWDTEADGAAYIICEFINFNCPILTFNCRPKYSASKVSTPGKANKSNNECSWKLFLSSRRVRIKLLCVMT